MELQQSPLYAEYVKKLGWKIEKIDSTNIFIKRIPFVGTFAKVQRIEKLPEINSVIELFKKYHIKRTVLEGAQNLNQHEFIQWTNQIKKHVTVINSPYIPTKTLIIDITPSEDNIFRQFSEPKRRAVRRAIKHNLIVKESKNIQDLIKIKNRSAGFLGFITTHGVKQLWEVFAPENATCVLAYTTNNTLIGGVLLIFWEDTAYYWIAGSIKKGKKLFAPTLLVWEAIKIAKKRHAKKFDFVGIWDERFPTENKEWLGFTKFKEGFGGTTLYYPTHQ
jgi:lipid II:glycine glycyltransferase (peptidoglycan interpeptide bridge formation enzyme)